MSTDESTEVEDQDLVYFQRFNEMQGAFLKTLVNDDVIEEYRTKPLGQHSEPLERLLLYFRRLPMDDKFAIKRDAASSTFKLIAFSSVRGEPPRVLEGEEYATVEEAYHGVFLKYVKELMDS